MPQRTAIGTTIGLMMKRAARISASEASTQATESPASSR